MIQFNFDEKEGKKIYLEKLEEHIKKLDKDLVFGTTKN